MLRVMYDNGQLTRTRREMPVRQRTGSDDRAIGGDGSGLATVHAEAETRVAAVVAPSTTWVLLAAVAGPEAAAARRCQRQHCKKVQRAKTSDRECTLPHYPRELGYPSEHLLGHLAPFVVHSMHWPYGNEAT